MSAELRPTVESHAPEPRRCKRCGDTLIQRAWERTHEFRKRNFCGNSCAMRESWERRKTGRQPRKSTASKGRRSYGTHGWDGKLWVAGFEGLKPDARGHMFFKEIQDESGTLALGCRCGKTWVSQQSEPTVCEFMRKVTRNRYHGTKNRAARR